MLSHSLSIIIASYQSGEFLSDCLASISAQRYPDIEIVVVDGGSTDQTLEILKNFSHPAFSWISEPDKGIYDALNKGVARSKGKWLYFLGADDRLLPDFSLLAEKLRDESSLYYGNSEPVFLGESQQFFELIPGKYDRYRLSKICLNHQSIIYPAIVFKKYSYDLMYKVSADYLLNMQVWGDSSFKRRYFPITIVQYNMTGISSREQDKLFARDKPALVRKSLGRIIYWRFLFNQFKKKIRGESN